MADWRLNLFLEGYLAISESGKEVEGRVPDPSNPEKDYSKINVGDRVIFIPVERSFAKITGFHDMVFPVIYNRPYKSAEEMLRGEGLRRVLPGIKSIEQGVQVYHSLPGYLERIKLHGIHAIGLGKRLS